MSCRASQAVGLTWTSKGETEGLYSDRIYGCLPKDIMVPSFSTRVAACLPSTSLLVERRVNSVALRGTCRDGNIHCRSPLQQDGQKQERRGRWSLLCLNGPQDTVVLDNDIGLDRVSQGIPSSTLLLWECSCKQESRSSSRNLWSNSGPGSCRDFNMCHVTPSWMVWCFFEGRVFCPIAASRIHVSIRRR